MKPVIDDTLMQLRQMFKEIISSETVVKGRPAAARCWIRSAKSDTTTFIHSLHVMAKHIVQKLTWLDSVQLDTDQNPTIFELDSRTGLYPGPGCILAGILRGAKWSGWDSGLDCSSEAGGGKPIDIR